MKKIIFAILFLSLSSSLYASDGMTVHVFDKQFTVPSNCEFFVAPSVSGETRFNCTFYNPSDPAAIYFRSREYCDKAILHKITNESKISKLSNGVQYIEYIATSEAHNLSLTYRIIADDKVCVYAIAIYRNNLDALLNGLWEK